MMLCLKNVMKNWLIGGLIGALMIPAAAFAQTKYAVVPNVTIYPGDVISENLVGPVAVTNPRLAGGYASALDQVVGKVSKRTLIAGRTIPLAVLQEPFTVKRGTNVRLTFSSARMVITARGAPTQDAMVGEVIKVRNLDTGVTVNGTVMADGSVEVVLR
jgi:flagella basal body P-ring formation protein FlgA